MLKHGSINTVCPEELANTKKIIYCCRGTRNITHSGPARHVADQGQEGLLQLLHEQFMTDLLWLNMLDLCLLVLNMLLGLQKCFLGKIEALLSGVLSGTNMRKHEPQSIKLNYKAEKKLP